VDYVVKFLKIVEDKYGLLSKLGKKEEDVKSILFVFVYTK